MGYSVKERANFVGTFRWISVQLMEMLARWVPTTPEMEVKVLFGRHVWDCAQHADAMGRRAFELRAPLHYTVPAASAYAGLLRDVSSLTQTADRIGSFYDVLCPGLTRRYEHYLGVTDSLMDEPTVRILQRWLDDHARMSTERNRLVATVPELAAAVDVEAWKRREQGIESVVGSDDVQAPRRMGSATP